MHKYGKVLETSSLMSSTDASRLDEWSTTEQTTQWREPDWRDRKRLKVQTREARHVRTDAVSVSSRAILDHSQSLLRAVQTNLVQVWSKAINMDQQTRFKKRRKVNLLLSSSRFRTRVSRPFRARSVGSRSTTVLALASSDAWHRNNLTLTALNGLKCILCDLLRLPAGHYILVPHLHCRRHLFLVLNLLLKLLLLVFCFLDFYGHHKPPFTTWLFTGVWHFDVIWIFEANRTTSSLGRFDHCYVHFLVTAFFFRRLVWQSSEDQSVKQMWMSQLQHL